MSDKPRFRALSPNPYVSGLLLDPKPGLDRGFAAPQVRQAFPDAVIRIPNAMSGTMIVRNPRSRLEGGVNAPRSGRAPGGDRHAMGVYGPSTKEFLLKILSAKLPQGPHFAPEMQDWFNNPSLDATLAALGQRQTEEEWLSLLKNDVDAQDERAFAESLFGTDLAGSGAVFTYSTLSADATHNPAGLTLDDPDFPFVDFIAKAVHTLDLSLGAAGISRYAVVCGEEAAHKLEPNKQLLGIQVKTDGTGTAMVNGEIRLTRSALAARVEGLSGVRKFVRAGAVISLTSGADANASHSWMWPDGIAIVAMGNIDARVNPVNNSRVTISNTGLVVLEKPTAEGKIYLPEDNIQFQGHADVCRQYLPVDSACGLAWGNS